MAAALTVTLFGGLAVERAGRCVQIAGRQPRRLLTLLALEAGTPVRADALVDRMWGERLPANPRGTLHTYVGRLRRVLGDAIVTQGSGYLLDISRDAVDVLRFVDLTDPAPSGEVRLERLRAALALWQGPLWASSEGGWIDEVARPWLVERRLAALEEVAAADLAVGRAEQVVAQLRPVVGEHPLRESAWVLLLTALERSGRPAEALDAYERVRRLLADELGADPGPELQEVQARLLAGSAVGVPHQLPADVRVLAGRERELELLDEAIAHGPPPAIAVHGVGAVGKTALAVHWAHRVTDRFPDGQIYVNLWGFGPNEPMPSREAIGAVMVGLGIPGDMPPTVEEASARLRSTLAGKRVLLVLDNARDAAQVRPLVPGGDSLALVTSRSQLRGLATVEGARRIALDALPEEAAVEMLRRRLPGPFDADDELALGDLAELCGRLPLALAVAAERCSRQPDVPLPDLVTYLRGESSRLAALESGEDPLTDLRAVFSWSYAALDPDAQRLFRALGDVGAPDMSAPACAALMGLPAAPGRRLLDRLVDANLVREHKPGRFLMHDLVSEYAAELCEAHDPPDDVGRRRLRLLDWAIASVTNAMTTVLRRPPRGFEWKVADLEVPPLSFSGDAEAWAWLDSSWPTFWVLILRAFDRREGPWAVAATYLTGALFSFFLRRPATEALALQAVARRVAAREGMAAEGAYLDNHLGVSHARLGENAQAEECFRRSVAGLTDLGLAESVLAVRGNLARHYALTGRDAEALDLFLEILAVQQPPAARMKVLDDLAGLYQRMGRCEEALDAAQEAVALEDGSTTAVNLVRRQVTLGRIHLGRGDVGTAADAYTAALAMLDPIPGAYAERVLVLAGLGELAMRGGDRARAVSCLRDALALVEEYGELDRAELTRDDLVALLEKADGLPDGRQGSRGGR